MGPRGPRSGPRGWKLETLAATPVRTQTTISAFRHFPKQRLRVRSPTKTLLACGLPAGAGAFPRLRELVLLNTRIEDRDLDNMLATSPELETLGLVVSYGLPEVVRIRGKKLQCVLFWVSMAVELALVDAPCLERLIMWHTCSPVFDESDDEPRMRVRITCAPELKVLGYLELGAHELQIEHTVIKADTKLSPNSMVPSVKILALVVNFSVSTEVRMLASVLRCFPNIETLHVESTIADKPTGEHYAEFFEELSPIECVWNHIKKMVLHNFRGDISEIAFLKFITQRANELQKLILVLPGEALLEAGQDLVGALAILLLASKACTVLLAGPIVERGWNFHRASDLSIGDPFLLEHEQELFCLIKKGELIV